MRKPQNFGLLAVTAVLCLWAVPCLGSNLDYRGIWTVNWISPNPNSNQSPQESYELRLSTNPPGGSPDAWWATAQPQDGLPHPNRGTGQSWKRFGLEPGETVYAAMKSLDANGTPSPLSEIISWTPPQEPFVQRVSPTAIQGCGEYQFQLKGSGLGDITEVRFHTASDTYFGTYAPGGEVVVQLPALEIGFIDLEIVSPQGNDLLTGWIFASPRGEPPTASSTPSLAVVDPLTVWQDSNGWHVELATALAPLAAEAGCPGGEASLPQLATLSGATAPTFRVFDVAGRLVADIQPLPGPGSWNATWSGQTTGGRRAPNGIFFLRAHYEQQTWNRKVFLVR